MVTLKVNVNNIAMGVLTIYPIGERKADIDFSLPYFSISVSLNILLTLMIVVRLILHGRFAWPQSPRLESADCTKRSPPCLSNLPPCSL